MKYLTTEELKKSPDQEVREVLRDHIGKNIQGKFALELFQKHARSAFGENKDIKILDLGPAGGAFGKQLAEEGYKNIYGADLENYLSPDNQSLFKELKTADLNTDRLPWPDGYFQAITAWCVFPHLENPFHCFREASRLLDKNGLLIFSAPNLESKASIHYFIKNGDLGSYQASNNHLAVFTRGIIEKAVLKYFSLVGVKYHIRDKVFARGLKGIVRKLIYETASLLSEKWKTALEKRWAYNAVYILRTKGDSQIPKNR